MSPATSVSPAGVTVTVFTSWATVTVALPDAEPAVAVIVAVPLPAAVTSPALLAVATAAALLAQLTAAPAIALPFWSRTSAESCTVAPQCRQLGRGRAHRDSGGPRGIGGRGRGFRRPVPAGIGPQRRAQARRRQ